MYYYLKTPWDAKFLHTLFCKLSSVFSLVASHRPHATSAWSNLTHYSIQLIVSCQNEEKINDISISHMLHIDHLLNKCNPNRPHTNLSSLY